MRVIVRSICILFIAATTINAQTPDSYGLKIGAAISNPVWKVNSQSNDRSAISIGMDAGLFLEWSLSNRFSILTEVHYIQKGLIYYYPVVAFQNETGFSVSNQTADPSVYYLSFPVLTKFKLFDSEQSPYLIGGLRIEFPFSKDIADDPRWLYNNVNDIDFGGTFGIGIQTMSPLGIGTGLEIKYSPNFTKVNSMPIADITNRSFEISLILYK